MSSPPFYPFYPVEYRAATSHLSPHEDLVYRRLLDLCWDQPDCSVPDDPEWLLRRLGLAAQADAEVWRKALETVLAEFFSRQRKRWFQMRLRDEFLRANDSHQRRKNAGKSGGQAKARKTKENPASNARALPLANPSLTRGGDNNNNNNTMISLSVDHPGAGAPCDDAPPDGRSGRLQDPAGAADFGVPDPDQIGLPDPAPSPGPGPDPDPDPGRVAPGAAAGGPQPAGASGGLDPLAADDWPAEVTRPGGFAAAAAIVADPGLDPAKSQGLVVSAVELGRWRVAGASWELDVLPTLRAVCARLAKRGDVARSWTLFRDDVLRARDQRLSGDAAVRARPAPRQQAGHSPQTAAELALVDQLRLWSGPPMAWPGGSLFPGWDRLEAAVTKVGDRSDAATLRRLRQEARSLTESAGAAA
jgi:uncharacterized protein YdaU (DUF1376 family)